MAKVLRRSGTEVTLEVTVDLTGTLLEMEGAIQEASNAVGRCATEEALKRFDTDGSPIRVGEIKLTARGRDAKDYQSPYGVVRLERYVYQSWRGGRIYCPLEHQARIIRGATPRFASQLSHKYAQLNVRAVQTDLEQNHGRKVARSYIQHVAEWVGNIAAAQEERFSRKKHDAGFPGSAIEYCLEEAGIGLLNGLVLGLLLGGKLKVLRPDVAAIDNNHVFFASGNKKAVFNEIAQVAGVKPSIVGQNFLG